MAGYREHISVSGLCGVAYGVVGAWGFGFTPVQGAIAGVLTWVSGMLPDVDSESGKPVREIFSLLAAAIPCVMLRRLMRWSGNPETTILLAIVLYAAVRYGASYLLGKLSVHRGMFHSIPALIIATELAFLGYHSEDLSARLYVAGGVALGFLSHLVLDEMYSVEWSGIRVRLNKSAGSALKIFGKELFPNVFTWSLTLLLSYLSLIEAGLLDDPTRTSTGFPPPLRQAQDDVPFRNSTEKQRERKPLDRFESAEPPRRLDRVDRRDPFDESPFFR